MRSSTINASRFRNRRDAERALMEIIEDGGRLTDYRVEEGEDGSCVIVVLGPQGEIAGELGV